MGLHLSTTLDQTELHYIRMSTLVRHRNRRMHAQMVLSRRRIRSACSQLDKAVTEWPFLTPVDLFISEKDQLSVQWICAVCMNESGVSTTRSPVSQNKDCAYEI